MHPLITSTQNPKIKNIVSLEKARERKKQQLFIVEGQKEIALALEAGYEAEQLLFCPEITPANMLPSFGTSPSVPLARAVFEKIAYRESTGGVIAVMRQKKHALSDIRLPDNPLVVVIEAVEKPGNLGAILRTSDAAGVDAVIVCDPLTDFYNPNVIRSSVGCVFTNQLASATSEETIRWLQHHGLAIICTYLEASTPYHLTDYKKPCAIVLGTEATGLSDRWVKNATINIIIPMQGKIDSMNVSTAAAVVVYEARRQRGFKV